jgi:uncharacterized protein (DUF2236 family)
VIVQRVNSERLVLLGWSRAILMQLAHPLIAAGVMQHSSFRGGAIQAAVRLHHTVGAMLAISFGNDERRDAAIARIQAIHRTVHGTLNEQVGPFAPGTPYSAEDPALLLWVHATLIDSSADIYQRVVAQLDTNELDHLCVESAPLLEELGGDPATTPRTWAALQSYLSEVIGSGDLAVTPETRALGIAVLSPQAAGVPLPLTGVHRLVATGLLPPALRDVYGFRWDAVREARFQRAIQLLRRARRVTPRFIACWRQASW